MKFMKIMKIIIFMKIIKFMKLLKWFLIIIIKKYSPGWVDGWVDVGVDGCKSRFKDCLQQSKKLI